MSAFAPNGTSNAHTHLPPDFYEATTRIPPERLPVMEAGNYAILNCTRPSQTAAARKRFPDQSGWYLMSGLHPWFIPPTKQEQELELEELRQLISANKIDGVGECGLDFSPKRITAPGCRPEDQIRLLKRQLKLAEEKRIPVTLHTVHCNEPLTALLKELKPDSPILFHRFQGSAQLAHQLSRLCRCYFSFSPELLQAGRKQLETIKTLPAGMLLLEEEGSLPTSPALETFYQKTEALRNMPEGSLKPLVAANISKLFANSPQ